MMLVGRKTLFGACCLVLALLGACGSSPTQQAPVEDRSTAAGPGTSVPVAVPPPGAQNAGKPGYYSVRKGDTISQIGREHNTSWRDIARWNNLDNPNQIEVGQVLRVVPPEGSSAATSTPVLKPEQISSTPAPAPAPAPTPTPSAASTASASASASEDSISFVWPVPGKVLTRFDGAKNKGIDLDGKAGQPVLAAAAGKVIYAGSGLRGYGNLIVLQNDNNFVTTYAHNRTLLVKADEIVKQGQKIAEMGDTDTDRVKLHFEIRRQGKPLDPARYLPAR